MSLRREVRLWAAQRATAVILAVCVFVHLATIIYAVQGGLSAGEILGRTRGSIAWAAFYVTFVFAAAIHAAIGLRTILAEWMGWRGDSAHFAITVFAMVMTIFGLRAVAAVYGG